jgi:hypothetical protein
MHKAGNFDSGLAFEAGITNMRPSGDVLGQPCRQMDWLNTGL